MDAGINDGSLAPLRVGRLRDLADVPALQAGTAVWIEERAELVSSVGDATAAIAARLGWPHYRPSVLIYFPTGEAFGV